MKKIKMFLFTIICICVLGIALIITIISMSKSKTTYKTEIKKSNSYVYESKKTINIPKICQYPTLPTGCEIVAATQVLQFFNDNITAENFAENWLECSNEFYTHDNKKYGPDPNDFFVGDPFTNASYGCYAPPIINAINDNSEKCRAELIKNSSLEEICAKYIDKNVPILIWATMGMKPSSGGNSWYLNNNDSFTWIAGEHCLVLVGYNEEYYFLSDPQSGSIVAYEKEIVEKRFNELGSQAVYIYKK